MTDTEDITSVFYLHKIDHFEAICNKIYPREKKIGDLNRKIHGTNLNRLPKNHLMITLKTQEVTGFLLMVFKR